MRTDPPMLGAALAAVLTGACAQGYEPSTYRGPVPTGVAADGSTVVDAGGPSRRAPTGPDAGAPAGDAGASAVVDAGDTAWATPPLPCGRTYDQDRMYFTARGDVSLVTLRHRDGTSLPATEGGASCGSGCTEQVTRLGDGASLSGVISAVDTFTVQAAASGADGVGTLVLTACDETLFDESMWVESAGSTPGFVNLPGTAWALPAGMTCPFTISARGGYVDLRAVTTSCSGGPTPPLS